MDAVKRIEQIKLVPVIKLDSSKDALPLAEALISGGLPLAEITFRTDAAKDSIKVITQKYPDMLVGAGTITAVRQAEEALDAGASFLVSAGFNRAVTEYAIQRNVPIFPGVCTPTELMMLLEYGLTVAKFFPSEQYGGLKTIQALSGPFPKMRFMPTGGINMDNILTYLSCDKVIACGGSWMVKDTYINHHEFDRIKELTKEAKTLISKEE